MCPSSLHITYGDSACPTGWNVSNWWGFYVQAEQAGSTIKMEAKNGTPPSVTLEYSTNLGSTWSSFGVNQSTVITLRNIGDLAYFRAGSSGNIQFASDTSSAYRRFDFTGSVSIGGNIMSLLS